MNKKVLEHKDKLKGIVSAVQIERKIIDLEFVEEDIDKWVNSLIQKDERVKGIQVFEWNETETKADRVNKKKEELRKKKEEEKRKADEQRRKEYLARKEEARKQREEEARLRREQKEKERAERAERGEEEPNQEESQSPNKEENESPNERRDYRSTRGRGAPRTQQKMVFRRKDGQDQPAAEEQ